MKEISLSFGVVGGATDDKISSFLTKGESKSITAFLDAPSMSKRRPSLGPFKELVITAASRSGLEVGLFGDDDGEIKLTVVVDGDISIKFKNRL